MTPRTYVGFGFGAIQAGLLLYEAHQSKNFTRLVVAEVVPDTVSALRQAGRYTVNIATQDGVKATEIGPVEVLNPNVAADRELLIQRIAGACEIGTALPSVNFFGNGKEGDVTDILRRAIQLKLDDPSLANAVIYTAENNNHAAEILWKGLTSGPNALDESKAGSRVQCLNTVIGKMCGIVSDPTEIIEQGLSPALPGGSRAFLVEAFNRILITKIDLPSFTRGITVFEEKTELLPFEEAKLYGHNATHALLGYFLWQRQQHFMSDATRHPDLIQQVRDAYMNEAGAALCDTYNGLDPLFTTTGFRTHVDDVLTRMVNPFLKDRVDRITRDPRRKLGWDDRLVGTMRLALERGIEPNTFSRGALAALHMLAQAEGKQADATLLKDIWLDASATDSEKETIMQRIFNSKGNT
jgi:mannitol-1-phosphate/altronate dehydrogenase